MNPATPTGLDFLAAVIVFIIISLSLLTLLGMGIMMAVGAIFSSRPLVTSWPDHEQQAFTTFERRSTASNSQAWTIGLVSGLVVLFLVNGIYFFVTPEKKNMTKDMNMSNLTKKRPAAVAPKADAAPKPDAPAEAPKADTPAAPAAAPAAPAEAPKQ
ncbi:MAG TPA: hypothetical protein VH165_22105 [Kofleriaceae bacterium]|jgi:hypothetical protein|nr:hypothetical protein [Kofleriaceae bacterium]